MYFQENVYYILHDTIIFTVSKFLDLHVFKHNCSQSLSFSVKITSCS